MSKIVLRRDFFNSPANSLKTQYSEIPSIIDQELNKIIQNTSQEAVVIIEVLPL